MKMALVSAIGIAEIWQSLRLARALLLYVQNLILLYC